MIAYLSFYEQPFAEAAHDALWAELRDHARALGIAAPAALDRSSDYRAIWRDPLLAFGQTCGLPLVTSLAGQVRLIATPVYDFPGCDGPTYRSLILVRDGAPFEALADLRGSRVAINARDSQSGYVALLHHVASLASDGAFFADEIETGSHLASLRAVMELRADVCACDCVTFGLIARHRPDWTAGLRVLDMSEATPAPPFITRGGAPDREVEAWREALRLTLDDPALSATRAFLGLSAIEVLPLSAYDRTAAMARAVRRLDQEVSS